MPKRHKNLFHTMTRERFDAAVKRLDERIPSLARHQVIVELMRLVALVGDGHTSIHPFYDPALGFRYYPLRFYLLKDGLHVQAAAREYAEAVGGRLVRFGDLTAEQAFQAVAEAVSRDNEMTLKDRVPEFMALPEALHACGVISNMEAAPLVVEKDGRQITVVLKPAGKIPPRGHGPTSGEQYDAQWVDARDAAKNPTPLLLKAPHNHYWFEYLPDTKTVYAQYNLTFDQHGETISMSKPSRTPGMFMTVWVKRI